MAFYSGMYAAHYPTDDAGNLQSFSELLQLSEDVIRQAAAGAADAPVDDLWLPFIGAAAAYKHRGFLEEREVRLVAMPGTKLAADKMKGVEGYEELPLREPFTTERDGRKCERITLFGADRPPLPLTRIIVGPSRSQDKNAETARKVVGEQIPVTKSETPYVG